MLNKMTAIAFAAAASALALPAAAQTATVDGQVQKIDPAQGKVTLRHAPIKNLDMDSMTMVFRVQDPAQLQNLKPGDKVKFAADRVNGQITIIKIEKAK
jgi:Cu(I)/Ag(I) efflux system periplasmic protein CusF